VADALIVNCSPTAKPQATQAGNAIRLKNGEVHEETIEAPHGSEKKFASDQDVIAKFRKLTCARM
jgi:hypothetical protein